MKLPKLSDHQRYVLGDLVDDIRNKDISQRTLGGYAGTGKTTLVSYLRQFFPTFGVCAYTGKAANVLRKKGIEQASTIHSRIYKAYVEHGEVYFDLTDDPLCDGFIVDEASMVSKEIYDDLMSFELPMIFVGDHGQLEPVDSRFNLMIAPDYRLEEIHRNAGDIAKFAEFIRNGYAPRGFKGGKDKVEFVGKITDDMLCEVDQVICAFNKTRVEINKRIRANLGFTGKLNVGERIMCLRNNKQLGLFNGMQGKVLNLYENDSGRKLMDFEFDGMVYYNVWYDTHQFGRETYDISRFGRDAPNPFDYANCVTAHKAQGDEWDNVFVIEQKCKNWSHVRWAYTCASRAKVKLYWKSA